MMAHCVGSEKDYFPLFSKFGPQHVLWVNFETL